MIMAEKKTSMTGFDLIALQRELESTLTGKIVDSVYIAENHLFLFKLNPGGLTLLFEPEKRLHCTKFNYKIPQKPPQLCMELRKHVKGCRVKSLEGNPLERIVYLRLEGKARGRTLVMEVFKRGNLMLLDEQDRIILSTRYAAMKDRRIARGEAYREMPHSGVHPLELKASNLMEAGEETLWKALRRLLPFPPLYIEECLLRSGFKGDEKTSELRGDEVERILQAVKSIYIEHTTHPLEPMIILDETEEPMDVVPRPLRKYWKNRSVRYDNFNEALDEYFLKLYQKEVEDKTVRALEYERQRITRALEEQVRERELIESQILQHLESARLIQENALKIDEALEKLRRLIEAEEGYKPIPGVVQLDLKNRKALLEVEGKNIWLTITSTAYRNAGAYYQEVKKLRRKLQGLNESLEAMKNRLTRVEMSVAESQENKPILQVKRSRQWYEKFRWFRSSEGFLVLIGRDAQTNRQLIEKYVEPMDIVLHAEVHGAPFAVIKTEGGKVGEDTIRQAAAAAVSYSKAWREGLASADAYWVHPHQLSRKPPSGEYMARGSYMIYGRRNPVRGVELKLAIGVVFDDQVQVVGGPPEAVAKATNRYVTIVPGRLKSGKLAKMVIERLKERCPQDGKEKLKAVTVDEVQAYIPSGGGALENRRTHVEGKPVN
jgi:predicted ribosome quality control (RQC) complex YloA/Tae2 family protein